MRVLEFALSTFIITVVNAVFAVWIATTAGNRIAELFQNLAETLCGVL